MDENSATPSSNAMMYFIKTKLKRFDCSQERNFSSNPTHTPFYIVVIKRKRCLTRNFLGVLQFRVEQPLTSKKNNNFNLAFWNNFLLKKVLANAFDINFFMFKTLDLNYLDFNGLYHIYIYIYIYCFTMLYCYAFSTLKYNIFLDYFFFAKDAKTKH